MIQTYHETKRYKNDTLDNSYFWFKNESYKPEVFAVSSEGVTSHPQFSVDGENWITLTDSNSPEIKPSCKIYMRSADGLFNTENEYLNIWSSFSGKWSVGGPIAALIDYTDIDNVTSIPDHCFHSFLHTFEVNTQPLIVDYSKIDFGNITTVGDGALDSCFQQVPTKGLPNLSNLTTIGREGMRNCFNQSYFDGDVDLSGLTTIGQSGMYDCFSYSSIKSVNLSSVTSLANGSLGYAFYAAYHLNELYSPNVSVWNTEYTNWWMSSAGGYVSGTKTFYAPTGLVIPTDDDSGIPNGWTRVDI